MRTITGKILLCLSLFSICISTHMEAQQFIPTPVEISTEKINVKGSILYVHKVLKGQTLYSVSKAYNVPIDVILKQNPTLKEGLKSGTLIYIPVTSAVKTAPQTDTKKAETSSPVQTNQPEIGKKYKKYTVKWYESLNDVADKYDIPVEAIIKLNSLGNPPVLKKRQTLLIPDEEYLTSMSTSEEEIQHKDEVTKKVNTLDTIITVKNREEEEDLYWYMTPRTYIISLVLPFNAEKGTQDANINQFDFYSGVLLALKDFQEETFVNYYKINVVDITAYDSVWDMLSSGVLDNSEIIIGPVYENSLNAVAQYAMKKRIPIVSPMDPKAEHLNKENPFFFQFPTSNAIITETLINKFAYSDPQDSVKAHLYFERGTQDSKLVTTLISDLENKNIEFDTLSYGILQGRGIDTIMLAQMDSVHLNKVLVASESEAFVSDILRNLHLLKSVDTINIEVYGQPRWKNFEIIELQYLHLLNTHLTLQYYVDYNSDKTKKFISDYWECFKAEPTPFAFQGYDIFTYFLSALNEFGREFPSHISSYRKSLLQSDINFVKKEPGSGFENQATRNIVYQKGWIINPWN